MVSLEANITSAPTAGTAPARRGTAVRTASTITAATTTTAEVPATTQEGLEDQVGTLEPEDRATTSLVVVPPVMEGSAERLALKMLLKWANDLTTDPTIITDTTAAIPIE